jgi:ribosome maturation factor RimP
LKVKQQYEKNTGRSIEVYMTDGEHLEGKLASVHKEHIVLKVKGNEIEVRFEKIKKAKAIISFNEYTEFN